MTERYLIIAYTTHKCLIHNITRSITCVRGEIEIYPSRFLLTISPLQIGAIGGSEKSQNPERDPA